MDFHAMVDCVISLAKCDPRDDKGFCILCGNFTGESASVRYNPKSLNVVCKHHLKCCWRIAKEANLH